MCYYIILQNILQDVIGCWMIFTYYLPEDFSEDELRRWLEGFGQIEEVFLLRDVVARMSMVSKTCQCPGRMLRFRSMFQEKLGEFGHVGVMFQGSQAQCERLRAIFIPSSCSNLYSSTSVRTSEFTIHPGTWGSGIQSVTSQFFSLAVYQQQHHAGKFMKIPFAPQVGARCWGRWCYRLVVSIWTGPARGLWPKSPQHASKQWWSPLGLIKENGMNLIFEDSFEACKTIQLSNLRYP